MKKTVLISIKKRETKSEMLSMSAKSNLKKTNSKIS